MYCRTCGNIVLEGKLQCPHCNALMTKENMSLLPPENITPQTTPNVQELTPKIDPIPENIAAKPNTEIENYINETVNDGIVKPINAFDYKPKKKLNKWFIILIGIVIGGLMFTIAIYSWNYFSTSYFKKSEAIVFDNESIPSIYAVTGATDVINVKKTSTSKATTITVTYSKDVINSDYINNYISSLTSNGYIKTSENVLATQSLKPNMVLTVTINQTDKDTKIIYSRVIGVLK